LLLGRRDSIDNEAVATQGITPWAEGTGSIDRRERRYASGGSMSYSDIEYYRGRALAERELAQSASHTNVALIHQELARQYQALVDHAELRPTLRMIFPKRTPAHDRMNARREEVEVDVAESKS